MTISNRLRIGAWTLYDFANTAFYVVILTVGYPLYFKEIVTEGSAMGEALWGFAFSISMFFAALVSPILGAAADYGGGKKIFLGFFTALCIVATASLWSVEGGMVVAGMLLLIFANIGFESSLVFYDSFLPELTTPERFGRVSGYGFAMGYLGSLITLAIALPLYAGQFAEENLPNVRMSFLVAAGMFFVFALPLFLFVKEKKMDVKRGINFIAIGYRRVADTFREARRYRNVGRFLLSYFIFIDAVNTIIVFSSLYARETLKMTLTEIIIFFLVVQTSAILGSLGFGKIADGVGHKKALTSSLLLWLVVIVAALFVESKELFFGVGIFAGIAMGSSQSTSRSLMSSLTPQEKRTEFFGFFSFFGKASAILGPALFGVMSSFVNQKAAVAAIGILLLVGLLLLQRVESPERQISTITPE